MSRALRWVLQGLLTVIVTVFLFRALRVSIADLGQLGGERWRPEPLRLALSFGLLLGVFVYLVALWSRLARQLGAGELKLAMAIRIFFVANLGRYVPGKVWQVAGLTYLASRQGLAPGPASFSAVLAQLFSLAGALAIGGFYAWVAPVQSPLLERWLAPVVAVAVLAVLAAPPLFRGLLRFLERIGGHGVETAPSAPRFAVGWFLLHTLAWAGYGAAFCILWAAFRPLAVSEVLLAATAFPAAYFVGYAAFFAPAGIGVREGALAALTAPVLGATDAASLAVVTRLWMTTAELLPLAWVGLAWGRRRLLGARRAT
ncbi:MAG: flippase-like domain-containing protein [Gemmatimonadetes bacterium]|nr:flippase-like domain-containing protein [Gemmatimonadota bacterium]